MVRAVLDSSVLVNAFLTPRGTCSEVLRAGRRGAFVLCLSRELLAETIGTLVAKRVRLARTYTYSEDRVARYGRHLIAAAQIVTDLPELTAVPLDPKDNMIVATAVRATAGRPSAGDGRGMGLPNST